MSRPSGGEEPVQARRSADLWCFTCNHGLARKRWPGEGYEHADQDEAGDGCPCDEEGIPCEPW